MISSKIFEKNSNYKKNYFNFINNIVKKHSFIENFLFHFFNLTSRITYLLFLDIHFFPIIVCCSFSVLLHFNQELNDFFVYLHQHETSFSSFNYAFTNILNFYLQIIFLYIWVTFYLIISNIFIIQIFCIRERMVNLYGPDSIKKRGY